MAKSNKNSFLKDMQNMFGVSYSPDAKEINDVLKMGVKRDMTSPEERKKSIDTLPWRGEMLELFKYWMTSCHDNMNSWKNREDMYNDCRLLFLNSPLIAYSMQLVADEVTQVASSTQPIIVEAKKKQKAFILDLFDRTGLYGLLPVIAMDIVKYGNAFGLINYEDSEIVGFDILDVFKVKDRLEFTAHEVKTKMKGGDKLFTQFKGLDRLESLMDIIKNKENISSYYKSYLFGFQIDDKVIPPWNLLHFKNKTSESPFKPFGVPTFIHSIAPYRQYDAAMTFQVLARGMNFPKEIFKLNIPNSVSASDKIQKAMEFLTEYTNSGIGNTQKEMPALGDIIITIQDLFEYDLQDPSFDLGKTGDIELLRDDLMVSTFLPRFLIDSNESGFGESGVALAEQWKPFARLVYRHQQIILENISQFVKIAMIHSNQFASDELDFILSMPYPESMTHDDLISNQQDLLSLASDIIDAIQDRITGGEELPPELIRDIYQKFLPYDDNKIDAWIDDALKSVKDGVDDMEESVKALKELGINIPKMSFKPDDTKEIKQWTESVKNNIETMRIADTQRKWKVLEKTVGKKKIKETVENIIIDEKQKVFREGIIKNKHYYSSKNKYTDFPAEIFRELDTTRVKALKESMDDDTKDFDSSKFNEQIEYEFESNNKNKKDETFRGLKHGNIFFKDKT